VRRGREREKTDGCPKSKTNVCRLPGLSGTNYYYHPNIFTIHPPRLEMSTCTNYPSERAELDVAWQDRRDIVTGLPQHWISGHLECWLGKWGRLSEYYPVKYIDILEVWLE
jgi:hypothetical protein